jgi:uncharacterized protein (DUF1501 family)
MSDHDHDHDIPPLPQHLIDEAEAGCEESRFLINRRSLLGMSGAFFAWAYMPRHAEAAGTEPRLLIVLLGGGMDGLHVAPPLNDPYYAGLRGDIAFGKNQLLALTSEFGLNPNMPNLKNMFDAKDAAMVQAIAPPLRRRSHFEGMYNIESGLPGVGARNSTSGWLNRLLQQLPPGRRVKMDALHIGPTPLILAGSEPVLSWTNTPNWSSYLDDPVLKLYQATNPTLADLMQRGLKTNSLALSGTTDATKAADKGISAVRINFRAAARMMRDEAGPRIAVLKLDGWDTHIGQISILSNKLADLDAAMQDLREALGSVWNNTAIVCVTEMGRTAAVNGNSGTDHGDASVAFLLGGAIAGGQVWGEWPGLAQSSLTDKRSLRATTDMRTVFKGVLADHLGVPTSILDTVVFPESADAPAMKDLLKNPVTSEDSEMMKKDVPTTGAGSSLADFRQSYGIG